MFSNKSELKASAKFYAAFNHHASLAPLNSTMVIKEARLVVEKTTSLLAYQNYLAQARSYKASRRDVSQEFEREVQAQARAALSDMRTLGASSLRLVKHMRNGGVIDEVLDNWQTAVKTSGPVHAEDVWGDLLADADTRRVIVAQGVTEEILAHITNLFGQFKPGTLLDQGRLAAEIKLPGRAQVARIKFAKASSGRPRNISELLRQGQFDRIVESFDRPGGIRVDIAASKNDRPVEVTEAALVAAVLGVQELARHVRKLEDTGLATYQGEDPTTLAILFVAGLVLVVIGSILTTTQCEEGKSPSNACKIGRFLIILGALLMIPSLLATCVSPGLCLAELIIVVGSAFSEDTINAT